MAYLTRIAISALSVFLCAYLLEPNVSVDSFWTALIVALVLSLLNAFVKPVLIILTIPITFVTLGLFLLVINAAMILLADGLIDGFNVNGFWWALLFSFLLSLVNGLFQKENKREGANH